MAARDWLVGAAATATVAVGAPALGGLDTVSQQTGIPAVALAAYLHAAATSSCAVRWQDLAGIGAVETGHGTHGGAHLLDDGTLTQPIESWAGAQGPMQFMPATWAALATDGDGDGQADVNDIDDATVAATKHLCSSGYQPDNQTARINALGEYNGGGTWGSKAESQAYVELVPAYADALPTDTPAPAVPGPPGAAPTLGSRAEAAWSALLTRWDQLGGLVAQPDTPTLRALWAGADRGLTGRQHVPAKSVNDPGGLEEIEQGNIATGRIVSVSGIEVAESAGDSLRQLLAAAIDNGVILGGYGYRSNADQRALYAQNCGTGTCNPPTAVPGTSLHEQGLAVDFTTPEGILRAGTPEFAWMQDNAGRFGWKNLPSESWHWSTGPNAGH